MTAIVIPNVFLPSTTISSTAMNANFTTVANAIQASLALAGTDTMTAGLRGANGTAALPAFTFGTDLNVGMFRKAADELGFSTNGVLAFFLDVAAKGWFTGAVDVAGATTLAGTLGVTGATTLASTLTMSNAANRLTFAETLAQVGAGFGARAAATAAATTDIGANASHFTLVSGNTGITSFGSNGSLSTPVYLVQFSGTPLLTHSASLILPDGANLQIAGGDCLLMHYESAGVWRTLNFFRINALPTVQRFTSGSGTYTPSAGVRYVKVRMVGGGGGGGAAITNSGSNGTTSSFGSWTAILGNGGAPAGGAGGTGGTGGTNGTGTLIARFDGDNGDPAGGQGGLIGGNGGSNVFGGGAVGGTTTGGNGRANSGGGGAGAGNSGGANDGAGGGAGEYVEFFVNGPSATAYTVGAGGAGGPAGSTAGGNGAPGIIIVEEYYQ